jgi:hypothetical protein
VLASLLGSIRFPSSPGQHPSERHSSFATEPKVLQSDLESGAKSFPFEFSAPSPSRLSLNPARGPLERKSSGSPATDLQLTPERSGKSLQLRMSKQKRKRRYGNDFINGPTLEADLRKYRQLRASNDKPQGCQDSAGNMKRTAPDSTTDPRELKYSRPGNTANHESGLKKSMAAYAKMTWEFVDGASDLASAYRLPEADRALDVLLRTQEIQVGWAALVMARVTELRRQGQEGETVENSERIDHLARRQKMLEKKAKGLVVQEHGLAAKGREVFAHMFEDAEEAAESSQKSDKQEQNGQSQAPNIARPETRQSSPDPLVRVSQSSVDDSSMFDVVDQGRKGHLQDDEPAVTQKIADQKRIDSATSFTQEGLESMINEGGMSPALSERAAKTIKLWTV